MTKNANGCLTRRTLHFGGAWERQIGTIRRVLDAMFAELDKKIDRKLYLNTLTPSTEADFHEGRVQKKYTDIEFKSYLQNYIR